MIDRTHAALRRHGSARLFGCSFLALCAASASPAWASCTPDPAPDYGTTVCSGLDADGLMVQALSSTVRVDPGAQVLAGEAAAITSARYVTVIVNGEVAGGTKPGLLLTNGAPYYGPYDPYAGPSVPSFPVFGSGINYPGGGGQITIGQGGRISGASAIHLQQRSDNNVASFSVDVTNGGRLTGTSGAALIADAGTAFNIFNNAGGTIDGISGALNGLNNLGRIDGGSGSAIAILRNSFLFGFLFNGGAIRSASDTATMSLISQSIGNEGTIQNEGSGEAIAATGALSIDNRVGGRVASAGAVAVRASGALQLNNAGTIVGSVISTAAAGQSSSVTTTAGSIDGDLLLGAGDDTLVAAYEFTNGRVAGVTGRVDGGDGLDVIATQIGANTSITNIVLPSNFERLRLDILNAADVRLAPGASVPNGIVLSGDGRFTVEGDLTTSGPAFYPGPLAYLGRLTFNNRGGITANLTDSAQSAVSLNNATFLNEGTVLANGGNGITLSGLLSNTGTVRASGTAAIVQSGSLTNTGAIDGGAIGLRLSSGTVTNSGSITGGSTGILLDGSSSTIDNLAAGRISGGATAISNATAFGQNAIIRNFGTISGDVDLRGAGAYPFGANLFVNNGGTVEGNLFLGSSDDGYLSDLAGSSGVTGTIDAGDGFDTAGYRVDADASATVALPATFDALAYVLRNKAALTLTAKSPQSLSIGLDGDGSVDLTADLSQTGRSVLDLSRSSIIARAEQVYVPGELSVVSRGTLTLRAGSQSGYSQVAAVNGAHGTFENAGTINVSAAGGAFLQATGIMGGTEIVNSGTISLDGARGVLSTTRITNSGSIVQAVGGAKSDGISLFSVLDNSGIISVDGIAVEGGGAITNSGTIESRTGTAITNSYSGNIVNRAGGVIRGAEVAIAGLDYGNVRNDGLIVGDVQLGRSYSFSSSTFISNGTLTGNLRFGAGNDVLLQLGDTIGVSGTIDGGDGLDTFGRSFAASGTASVGSMLPTNFERELVDASGEGTVVTVTGPAGGSNRDLYLTGNGSIVNQADVTGSVHLASFTPVGTAAGPLGAFNNQATIGAVEGTAASFINNGKIGSSVPTGAVVNLHAVDDIAFSNSGAISNQGAGQPAAVVQSYYGGTVSIGNTGTITGGLRTDAGNYSYFPGDEEDASGTVLTIENSGTITSAASGRYALQASSNDYNGDPSTITFVNSGKVSATGALGTGALLTVYDGSAPSALSVVNSGTIEATGEGRVVTLDNGSGTSLPFFASSTALLLNGGAGTTATVTNGIAGTIATRAARSTALVASGTALDLVNAGTISAGTGTDQTAVAISSSGRDDKIVNSGIVTGKIDLGAGNDSIENLGTITGDVFLRDGDDRFIQHASAKLIGTVNGGSGIDALIVDATGGGSVNGDQFVDFESFAQTGSGNVTYTGNFNYDTITLNDGTITVAAGTTLRANGPVAITGTSGSESVANYGTIVGRVSLAAGDDSYTEGPGSSAGAIDGGSGTDTYIVALAGDRSGIGARTAFERLSVTGSGTLGLTLDQSYENIALAGSGLDLRLGSFVVGGIDGSAGDERLIVDGDVARVTLGAGDDTLSIAASMLTGSYDGGIGNDRLALTAAAPVTLAGTAAGFETLALAGGALTVTGTLGNAGGALSLGDGAQALTVDSGGRLLGTIDLGAGDDSFRLLPGGLLQGSVSGGAGADTATLMLASDLTIGGDSLRDFEVLTASGGRTLIFGAGAGSFGRIVTDGGLTVAGGATLTTTQVQFGSGDNRFVIAGAFTGSADGGAGSDAIALSGGTAAAPVAFRDITAFEALAQTAGFATVAGKAQVGRIDLTGGRLIGLAGSTIAAPQINVGTGATFGSAGTVIGNVAVAGTLSPGASPGTMTVTGNVSLAAGSTSLFELTPAVSDKLVVSGALSIANGATLTLTGNRPLTPGAALDLIVAGGGISGSFSTINQPVTIFGFLRQSSDRIQLFGQFDAAGFSPQVAATVTYVNGLLTSGRASPALIAAVPSLLTPGNATNGAAFARLNAEAYASATQISIENGLTLAKVSRAGAATTSREQAGMFTFAQGLGNWRPLDGDAGLGVSTARTNSYGLLGGIGFGSAEASLAGFVGYLDSRQRISALGARTDSDGVVAGLRAHAIAAGFEMSALLAYDGGKADTRRAVPGQLTATGRYHLRGVVSDTSVGYAVPLSTGWSLRPEAGLTYIETRRGGVTESGGGAFSLDIARRKSHVTFVDGALTLRGGDAPGAMFHPWISAGARHQMNGRATLATASFVGSGSGFSVPGVSRQATLVTAGAGASLTLTPGLEFFAAYRGEFGSDGTGSNVNGGVKLRF